MKRFALAILLGSIITLQANDSAAIGSGSCDWDSWTPVCGTDGKTYSSDCWRDHYDVGKDHDGACDYGYCKSDDDCRRGFECRQKDHGSSKSCQPKNDHDDDWDDGHDDHPSEWKTAWQTVGSTGSIDESSRTRYTASKGNLYAKKSGSVISRYNIDCETDLEANLMQVRYRDNRSGSSARVRVTLYRKSFITGQESSVAAFDSDKFAPSDSSQIASRPFNHHFNCDDNAYYVKAQLDRKSRGRPILEIIRLVEDYHQ